MESLNIRREIGDKAGIGDVLIDLGVFYGDHGQPDQALKLYKESLQIQTDLGNEQNRALLLNNIGAIYLDKGDYQAARTFYEQALQIRLKFNVPADIADTRHNLGEIATNLGLYEQALDQYHQALDLQRKVGNKQKIAIENSSLGTVFGYQGRYGAALSAKQDAFKSFHDLGERSLWTVIIDSGYGEALAQVGQHEEAKKILDEAIGLARELKNQDEIARTLSFQGDNAYFSGDLKTARQFYAQALSTSAKSTDVRLVLSAKFNLAKLDVDEGHAQAALKQFTALAGEADRVGFKYLSLQASLCLAQAQIQLRNFSQAEEILETVMVQTDRLGLLSLKGQAHALLAKALEGEHKPAEAERERNAAQQLFKDIQAEGHFDLRSRYDLASSLS